MPVPAPTSAPRQAPPRPVIKLKVSNAQATKAVERATEHPKASSKAKVRNPTVPDEAPPPYVDDGSHDLLQEVIAIEREKNEVRRHRKVDGRDVSPNRATGSGPPGKRRKRNVEGDDDILALTAPLTRKEKASTSFVASGTSTPAPERSATPITKPVPPPPKAKKEKAPPPMEAPGSVVEVPSRISIKGKEKETSNNQVSPSKPRPTATANPINEKKCRDVLRALSRLPEYLIFSEPVDPVRDGCPT